MSPRDRFQIATFPSELGWGALLATARRVYQTAIGYASAAAATAALDRTFSRDAELGDDWNELITRLQDYVAGRPVDFSDVRIDETGLTEFQRQVIRRCRQIPYGQTRSYGELAQLAGAPGAARAVGSTMAHCRVGLIVPCHRVVNANGSVGSFGGPQGASMKRKLLELERRGLEAFGKPRKNAR